MAVDEMLLQWAAERGGCCWRFYRWQEPTLSLGYFQEYHERWQHPASRNCPVVRRLTGGGAILHDAELTYSLVVPAGHPLSAARDLLYRAAHESLIVALAEFGIAAALCEPGAAGDRAPPPEPLLCFQRRAFGDVVVGQTKIAGSAQRRRRGAVLQHGSVILRRSAAAPELAALEDVAPVTPAVDDLVAVWLVKLAARLAVAWVPGPRSPAEERQAAALAEGRYSAADWTERRGP